MVKIPEKYQAWINTRKQFHLSHAHIQMAKELGMNPKKFGKLANNNQEPWKLPLPLFIEKIYFKQYGKKGPDNIQSIEEMLSAKRKKTEERKKRKLERIQLGLNNLNEIKVE